MLKRFALKILLKDLLLLGNQIIYYLVDILLVRKILIMLEIFVECKIFDKDEVLFVILKSNECCTGKILLEYFVMGKFAKMWHIFQKFLTKGLLFLQLIFL